MAKKSSSPRTHFHLSEDWLAVLIALLLVLLATLGLLGPHGIRIVY
jgi:hypothetical protein